MTRFETQGRVTWNGDEAIRPRGSTGKAIELKRHKIHVAWGYDPTTPRHQQPNAERWEHRSDLLPGVVRLP